MDINSFTPCREGRDSIFVSEEKNCKHIAKNVHSSYVRQFAVDGQIFPKSDTSLIRCDYLLLNDDAKTSYYIELKGSDVIKASEQIDHTVSLFKDSIKKYVVYPRIIFCSGTHQINSSGIIRWKNKYKGRAVIGRKQYEENI